LNVANSATRKNMSVVVEYRLLVVAQKLLFVGNMSSHCFRRFRSTVLGSGYA
jgi:hypothetical protein